MARRARITKRGGGHLFGQISRPEAEFQKLCEDYYEKILRYSHHMLGNEAAARDCTQEVFLLACRKRELLAQHPNPGGFLFQSAKNLIKKQQREAFRQMALDTSLEELASDPSDPGAELWESLDRRIDAPLYLEAVLSRLDDEKRRLYALRYLEKKSMAEIAALLALREDALRMRYVRLRREIREIVVEIAEQNFV